MGIFITLILLSAAWIYYGATGCFPVGKNTGLAVCGEDGKLLILMITIIFGGFVISELIRMMKNRKK